LYHNDDGFAAGPEISFVTLKLTTSVDVVFT